MFYLLKGTQDRERMGDVIIKIDAVECVEYARIITSEETYFKLKVSLKSKEYAVALYGLEDEVKAVVKELGVTDDIIANYICHEHDEEKEREEKIKKMLGMNCH